MIELLVGLGNPGPEHALDRHNAGFWLVDQIATAAGVSLKPERGFFGDVARVRLGMKFPEAADIVVVRP